ncbi:MFS transporter [Methanolobus sediminis]|uniref:MFS transporter n=1 Tax=Methanolobus sediminis TaxID=3072978 RepID=A0AA51UJS1_9EURY|nr:MFS transporter [Methanolobus sediminis]WMW24846.1 MFS transporter [Methanolobus sediminis]
MEGIPTERLVTSVQKSKSKNKHETLKLIVILGASMLTIMGAAAIAPALPEMLKFFADVPNAGLFVSMVVTLPALGIIISSPFIGVLADKYSRKKMLIVALAIFGFVGASGAVLNSLYMILACRVLLGIGISGMTICATALLADNYSGVELRKKMGLQSACMGFGAVILEITGGALADISWHAPFYIYLISLVLIPGALISISSSKNNPVLEKNELKNNKPHGHAHRLEKWNLDLKSIALIYIATIVMMVLFFSVPTKLPFVLDEKGIDSALLIGALISIPGLFATFGALSHIRISGFISEIKTNVFFFMILGAGVFTLSIVSNMTILIAGLIVTGIAFGIINATNLSWLGRIAPEQMRGKIFSGYATVLFFGQFICPIVIQPILKTGTLYDAYAFLGIAAIALGIVFGIVNVMGIIEQTPVITEHHVAIGIEE